MAEARHALWQAEVERAALADVENCIVVDVSMRKGKSKLTDANVVCLVVDTTEPVNLNSLEVQSKERWMPLTDVRGSQVLNDSYDTYLANHPGDERRDRPWLFCGVCASPRWHVHISRLHDHLGSQ